MNAEQMFRELREQQTGHRRDTRRGWRRHLSDEQMASLLGATAVVFAAVRELATVSERVVRERQAGLVNEDAPASTRTADDDAPSWSRIDLTY